MLKRVTKNMTDNFSCVMLYNKELKNTDFWTTLFGDLFLCVPKQYGVPFV